MLIRQTFAYLPAQILGPLIQFAAAISLTHFLSPVDYGVTMLIFASQELIFLLCLSWWTFYMLRYGGSFAEGEAKARFERSQSTILLASSLVQVLLTLVLIRLGLPDVSLKFYVIVAFFVVTRSFLSFLSESARAHVRIGAYSLVQVAAPLGGLILSVLVLQRGGPHAGWVLACFALMQGLVGLYVALKSGIITRPLRPEPEILRAALRFGLPVVISGALAWVSANGIRFVVQEMGGAEALGLLSVGWAIATRLAGMAGMLVVAAAYPLAVRAFNAGDVEGARAQLSSNSALLMLVLAPAVAGLIAIDVPLVTLLISEEFQAISIAILPAAILGAGVRNMRIHGWDQLYLLFEAQRELVLFGLLEVLVTLLGAVLGMKIAGIMGAVIGTTLAAIALAAFDYVYLRMKFGLHAPFGQYLRILAAALFMLGMLMLPQVLGHPLAPGWGVLSLIILAGAVLYIGALAALFPGEARKIYGLIRQRL